MTVSELKKGFVSIERVKKGGQKIVYKATRPDTSIVALKVINNATDPRVLQEIEVVQKLPIKNIPQILEHGVVHDELIDEDVLYIVEEFVEGVSMRDYLSAGKKMNLAYAHKLLKALSTGFSGNLGFKMPSNWAFDQFVTTTIGSGNGEIEIDKDGYSGYDPAVSRLNAISSEPSPDDLFIGNAASDKIVGPTLDILGYQFPLFEFDIGLESKDLAKMNVEYDPEKETFEVLIGFNEGSFSSETTGGSTKTGKFKEYYREVKTAYSLIGENNQEFSRHFKDFKGSLYQRGTKVGFECERKVEQRPVER